jgi:hypothetical protein
VNTHTKLVQESFFNPENDDIGVTIEVQQTFQARKKTLVQSSGAIFDFLITQNLPPGALLSSKHRHRIMAQVISKILQKY